VVRNSPEWYERLRTAKYLIDNMYQPGYHNKPPGQVVVETFHGYPFKVMGHPHWEKMQVSRHRIELYDQRAREWDYLVSPARYATPLLRRDFAYDGEVLEIGYPRNDVLLSPEAPTIRSLTRKSMGIADGVTVVLYAPTFRDYLSKDDHKAQMGDFLDPELLARSLGDDYVLLIRGHAFHARTSERSTTSDRVIDVTDYPDPADLYLASDLAVLDYSSLRFDYALTGKPMLFLVPDLGLYENTRGWLLDYSSTAPGPFLKTTDEVTAAIKEIDAVIAEHGEAYREFRETYLDLEDGQAAARLVDAVFVPRGDASPRR
jgi:CDP-glycerol glycerophosphotransferase